MFVYLYKQLTKRFLTLYSEDTLSTCYLLDYLAIYMLLLFIWLKSSV